MIDAAARLFDPLALLLVGGGSLVAAIIPSTREDLRSAINALGPLLRARPAADAAVAELGLGEIERIVELKGIGCADHVHTVSPFVRRAALKLVDAPTADEFAAWARTELGDRAVRHGSAQRVWRSAAEAAPAVGMIGTVIGLIGMFAVMDDPASVGPAMALAMLTTLYGLLVSAVFAGPVAARLDRLSEAERRWQEAALARLEALARADPLGSREWLRRRMRVAG